MERIVSLCPSNTEILFLLGLKDRIVGVDDYSRLAEGGGTAPEMRARSRHRYRQGQSAPSRILVIASLSVPGMEKNIEGLKREGIPHIVLAPNGIGDIAENIRRTGEAAGIGERAERVADRDLNAGWRRSRECPERPTRRRLYWEWWPKPVFTPGRRNWLSDVSEIVGGYKHFGDMDRENVQTDWEEVARRKPDVALIVWTGVPTSASGRNESRAAPPWQGRPFVQ